MATLTVQPLNRTGLDLTAALTAAAVGGDEFANGDLQVFFAIDNGGGAPITVTFVTEETIDGLAVADRDVVVVNATQTLVGPFPPSVYNDADKKVQVTYSAVASVTVAAIVLAKS